MTTIDLSALKGNQGYMIKGDTAGDQAGFSVSSAGDVNGDGTDDFIVGAPAVLGQTNNELGAAYVIYGKAGSARTTVDLSAITATVGFVIHAATTTSQAGFDVASAGGDINGDGIDDLIVSAPFDATGTQEGAEANAGKVYVIYGNAEGGRDSLELSALSASDGFTIKGTLANDHAGMSVASAGDVNNDQIVDIIIGAPGSDAGATDAGAAYVIYGQHNATRADVTLGDITIYDGFVIQGGAGQKATGFSVSGGGDLNGDGIDDIVLGAPQSQADDTGISEGKAFVIYGVDGTRDTVDLGNIGTADGFAVLGDVNNGQAGFSVAALGDVNGDGNNDFVVGVPYSNEGAAHSGQSYVIYGAKGTDRTTLHLSDFSSTKGFIVQGGSADDLAGFSVSAAGDVNGDGFDDILVGAYKGANGSKGEAGRVYVIYGSAAKNREEVDISSLSSKQGFILVGGAANDHAGFSVSAAGDVNKDGIDDLIIGARHNDAGGADAGAAYIFYGARPTTAVNRMGTDIAQKILGGALNDTIAALKGDDTLDGGSGNDSLDGGDGNDSLLGARGDDILIGGAGADTLDGGQGFDIVSYTGISTGVTIDLAALTATGDDAEGDVLKDIEGVFGSQFDDTISGDTNANLIKGEVGRDLLSGGEGNDTLDGGMGPDTLQGGDGQDVISYASSDAAVRVNLATQVVSGFDAVGDVISGFEGAIGSRGKDVLVGSSAANSLAGGAGNDTLTGAGGQDFLYGGAGRDVFRFVSINDTTAKLAGADVIGDFVKGQDKIDLSAIDAMTATGKNDRFTFDGAHSIGTSKEGDVSYKQFNSEGSRYDYTLVYIDTDADKSAEAVIKVMGLHAFSAGDFIL